MLFYLNYRAHGKWPDVNRDVWKQEAGAISCREKFCGLQLNLTLNDPWWKKQKNKNSSILDSEESVSKIKESLEVSVLSCLMQWNALKFSTEMSKKTSSRTETLYARLEMRLLMHTKRRQTKLDSINWIAWCVLQKNDVLASNILNTGKFLFNYSDYSAFARVML